MTHARRASRGLFLLFTILPPFLAPPALALDLAWPDGAERVVSRVDATAEYPIATGGFGDGAVPTRAVQGALIEEVWQVPGITGPAAPLYSLLRDQIASQGYEIGFTCADAACGGFDFRYALPIAQGPAMHVDLGDFLYLSATRATASGPEHVALTVSQGGRQGYAHLARVVPDAALPTATTPSTRQAGATSDPGLIARLTEAGHAVLEDMEFETGASTLSGQRYDSLAALAAWLDEVPGRRIVLVGHTDTEGALDSNIALSEARAAAVRRFLIEEFNVDGTQVEAAGVGYLAPRAANTDAGGREANRRVEVVLVAG